MKTVGFVVSFLCLLVALVITWTGYVCLFDETNIIPAFESDPREGWDYWLQREYWHDLQWFTASLLTAILCVGVPVIGRILDGRPIRVRPVLDVTLAAIAAVYVAALITWIAWSFRQGVSEMVQMVFVTMLLGGVYGLSVFMKRVNGRKSDPGGRIESIP